MTRRVGVARRARPALRRLAARAGILAGYVDARGVLRRTDDATRVALLAAMELPARSEREATATLRQMDAAAGERLLPPVAVAPAAAPITVRLQGPRRRGGELCLLGEDGAEARVDLAPGRPALLPPLAAGIYRLHAEVRGAAGGVRTGAQTLIVAPAAAHAPPERAFGVWCNLYALRGGAEAGCGTTAELGQLIGHAASAGADFVGLNPLHATRCQPPEISPYSGISRLFRSPAYLDVAALPEAGEAPAGAFAMPPEAGGPWIDYPAVAAHREAALAALLPAFRAGRGRSPEFAAFVARDARAAWRFAVFCALDAEHGTGDWRRWPAPLRDPASAAVAEFAAAHADAVDRQLFAQFALDVQLAGCAARARALGMRLGLYHDLALGALASGFDAWAFPGTLVCDVSLGAPPDDYCADGQVWGVPPTHPHRAAADGHRYFRAVLRAASAHGGMLRIDHAMGLQRQYWIPRGAEPARGAYVRYPLAELLGIVTAESRARQCVIVGEDLGTVPRGFSRRLAEVGVLSSRVLLFERDRCGFRDPRRFSPGALLTANTHDHPSLWAWWTGADLDLRERLGLPVDRAERARARAALVRGMRRCGLSFGAAQSRSFVGAVHRFLARSPCLVGVSFDDLIGGVEPVNLPGVGTALYPAWSRRTDFSIAAAFGSFTGSTKQHPADGEDTLLGGLGRELP